MEKKEDTDKKVFGLEENVAGALAYIGGFVTGFIFYLAEEDNKFVRFHALQSILLSIPLFIVSIIWSTIWSSFWYSTSWYYYGSYFLIHWISRLFWILTWILLLFLMSKAYKGKKFKLPVIGNIAEKNA